MFSVQRFDVRDLRPIQQLTAGARAGQWISSEDDPCFHLTCSLRSGWLHLQLSISSAPRSDDVVVYFDYGRGFELDEGITLGSMTTGSCVVDRYIPITRPVRGMRLDPLDAPGAFDLLEFKVELLPRWRFLVRTLRGSWVRGVAERNLLKSAGKGAALLLTGRIPTLRTKLLASLGHGGYEPRAYDAWMRNHAITPERRAALRAEAEALAAPPKISVILPVYNPPEQYLRRALDSVCSQIYPHWELCVADDASTAPWVKTTLAEYAQRDGRIKVNHRTTNGGISAASNTALEMASGSYVALLDHDDELAEHALLSMAREIAADPGLDILYSDEDKLRVDGKRTEPFFKPDWSPEYLLAINYLCHLTVLRTQLVRQAGGFRSVCDGAQDFDLFLRATGRSARIKHIADILYHWRMIPGSTALVNDAKPRAHAAGTLALREALAARGVAATVEPGPWSTAYSVRYRLSDTPRVSIIIPSTCKPITLHGTRTSHIENCVRSITEKSSYRNFEIIVLDRNQMATDLEARLAGWSVRRITYDQPFNWSAVNNLGAAQANGAHLLFLNDDMEILTPDWLERLLEFSARSEIGAVGGRLVFPDQRLQHVGVVVANGLPHHSCYGRAATDTGYFGAAVLHRNVSAVTGACMMTRAEVFNSVGRFGEEFPLNYNDIDYCLKVIAAGKRIVYTPYAQLLHHESASRQRIVTEEEIRLFRSKWVQWRDPFYSPNFAQEFNDYGIATT